MRTIVHISDLHFGHHDPRTVPPLVETIRNLRPDAVVVSGDLTQRARRQQFVDARAFLDQLPGPKVVVPGNHDIPLYDVVRRFGSPLDRFRELISDDVEPFLADREIAVMGLNTARSLTWKSGRLSDRQLEDVAGRLAPLPDSVVKVVVTHHPFDVPQDGDKSDLVKGAHRAMAVFARAGADVFLSGHLHVSHIGQTAQRYRIEGHSALVINAGTATSTRHRGEVNTFNVLRFDRHVLTLDRWAFDASRSAFDRKRIERYAQRAAGWDPLPDEPSLRGEG